MSTRKIGKYEVIERLGRGGMAEVYRAYHSNLDRYVAIKVLHAFLADDPEFKSRFEREAQNVAKLRHPNIVQVYDFEYDAEGESYYMVMELIDGVTLKDKLAKNAERGELLPIQEVLRIVREAASALAYAHSRSMIHRDVKPANLMIESHDNRLVLTDFGIAKIVTGAQFTASGGMVGTPAYMAPEQGLGEAGDERSDLYSLGIILFQLLTGRLPYDAETPLAIILKHLNTPTPLARALNPSIPEALENLVQKAIAKEPQDRYQNALELINDLSAFEQEYAPANGEGVAAQPIARQLDRDTTKTGVQTVGQAGEADTRDTLPVPMSAGSEGGRRIPLGWLALIGTVLIVAVLGGMSAGIIPVPGFVASLTPSIATTAAVVAVATTEAPTSTPTRKPTETSSPTPTPSATATASATLTATPATPVAQVQSTLTSLTVRFGPGNEYPQVDTIPTGEQFPIVGISRDDLWYKVITPKGLEGWVPVSRVDAAGFLGDLPRLTAPTLTPTRKPTNTLTPTATLTPSPTFTPSPNAAQTAMAATQISIDKTATARACVWDYAIKDMQTEQTYQKNAEGFDIVPANSTYKLIITFVNTGTCSWGANTSLVYVDGADLDAERFNFFRDRESLGEIAVGSEAVLEFVAKAPAKGDSYSGRWQLKTPGQLSIGEPITISIQSFEGG